MKVTDTSPSEGGMTGVPLAENALSEDTALVEEGPWVPVPAPQ